MNSISDDIFSLKLSFLLFPAVFILFCETFIRVKIRLGSESIPFQICSSKFPTKVKQNRMQSGLSSIFCKIENIQLFLNWTIWRVIYHGLFVARDPRLGLQQPNIRISWNTRKFKCFINHNKVKAINCWTFYQIYYKLYQKRCFLSYPSLLTVFTSLVWNFQT